MKTRIQRIAFAAATAGLATCVFAVVVLKIEPVRAAIFHEVLHRSGLAMMLAGLSTLLVVSVFTRHRTRIERALRASLETNIGRSEGRRILRHAGAALMAASVIAAMVARVSPHLSGLEDFALTCIGIPGVALWLAGVVAGMFARGAKMLGVEPAPAVRERPRQRATVAYAPWSDDFGPPSSAEMSCSPRE